MTVNLVSPNEGGGFKWDMTVNPAMLGALLFQAAVLVWWASGVTSRIEQLERIEPQTAAELARLNEAREELRLSVQSQTQAIAGLRDVLTDRTQRFDDIQRALTRLEHRESTPH